MTRKPRGVFYSCRRWRRITRTHLQANPFCADCGKPAELTHHVKPINWDALPDDLLQGVRKGRWSATTLNWLGVHQPHALDTDNLQSLCFACHEVAHSRGRGTRKTETGAERDLRWAADALMERSLAALGV